MFMTSNYVQERERSFFTYMFCTVLYIEKKKLNRKINKEPQRSTVYTVQCYKEKLYWWILSPQLVSIRALNENPGNKLQLSPFNMLCKTLSKSWIKEKNFFSHCTKNSTGNKRKNNLINSIVSDSWWTLLYRTAELKRKYLCQTVSGHNRVEGKRIRNNLISSVRQSVDTLEENERE